MESENPSYYCLDVGSIPDHLYSPDTPVEKWLDLCSTAGAEGFPASSLASVQSIPLSTELESVIRIPLYMLFNLLPVLLPGLCLCLAGWKAAAVTVVVLFTLSRLNNAIRFSPETVRKGQYVFTERNNQKYVSLRMVWPKSLHRPACGDKPIVFCMVPHGVAPIAAAAYPFYSKLFNDRLCRWTTAPVVTQLPVVGLLLQYFGMIPARSKDILSTLTVKNESVGVVLDGIAGMFNGFDPGVQRAHLNNRTTIVKLAMEAGAPIVPMYAFGQTSLYSMVVDPWGILEGLSVKLNTSITPFFGRWFWPLGPPRRNAVTVAFGEPVVCPQVSRPAPGEDCAAYEALVKENHQKMLASFKGAFDQHKAAYGVPHKRLVFT